MTEQHRMRDDADSPFRILNREHWQRPDHEAALLERLLQVQQAESLLELSDRRRRRFLAAGFLLGGALALTTVTACGGLQWLRELLSVRVFDVERGEDGAIEELTLEDRDGRLLQLRPIEPTEDGSPPEAPGPFELELPRVGGGTLDVRVLRDGGLGLAGSFASVGSTPPQPGEVLELRPIGHRAFSAELLADRLVLHYLTQDGTAGLTVLPAVAGQPHRYADGATIIEVLR